MYLTYKGHEIRPSRTTYKEMCDLRLYLDDILKVLEMGKDASRSRRKKNIIEKAHRIRGRLIKVVIVESETRNDGRICWLVTHVGETCEHGSGK